ncbi:MAG TPA: dephospho-CoA kinase [Alphaproteobacteria bacterium]|jgi:dephospho-CoA kinase|nr:dephospho-CoA kinase [Alphaproteobacteria bacterium]
MIVLGVTGSIGMGKTTAAAVLRRLGVPVFEADTCVHRLLAEDGAAVPGVTKAFPEAVRGGAVDRAKLGAIVFADQAARRKLEDIVHPLVRAAERRFLKRAEARRAAIVALDIPLLFETGADAMCDATIVVTAPRFVQERRVLARPGMTKKRLAQILSQQMPDAEKRKRADFTVATGLGLRAALNDLRRIVRLVAQRNRRPAHVRRAPRKMGPHARNRPRYRNHGT